MHAMHRGRQDDGKVGEILILKKDFDVLSLCSSIFTYLCWN